MASTISGTIRPATRLRWTLVGLWLPLWDYLFYPVIQWSVVCCTMIYIILVFRVFNRMTIIGREHLASLKDSGDLLASWHESMCDSFVIGAAIGPSLIWRQRVIPWNFAAAENFWNRWWVRILVTMLKTFPVKSSANGKRADGAALRQAIKLLQTTNVILFPAGTRFKSGQTEEPVAPAGFGLTVLKAKRVIPIAFVGVGGRDGLLPYYKTRRDMPRKWYSVFGRYSGWLKFLDWVIGIRYGRRVTMIIGQPLEVAALAAQFEAAPDREQQIANLVMNLICQLRRQIL